jgi:hypothetical protein
MFTATIPTEINASEVRPSAIRVIARPKRTALINVKMLS